MKIIINADDFGMSKNVNKAIYKSAVDGYITSSTILAVSKYVDDAVQMSKDLQGISFGVHLAFTDDFKSILQKPYIFNQNDIVNFKGVNLLKLNILVDEFGKQIEKLKNMGINLSHIDTHHHIHRYPLVLLAVVIVAKKYKIMKIRSQRLYNSKSYNYLYRFLHHNAVNMTGLIQPTYYSDFKVFFQADLNNMSEDSIYEIMCHPGSSYDDEKYFNEKNYKKIRNFLINYEDL